VGNLQHVDARSRDQDGLKSRL